MNKIVVGFCLLSGMGLASVLPWKVESAPVDTSEIVNYSAPGEESVPLRVRKDIVAVKFKRSQSRGPVDSLERLQQDLLGTRSQPVATEIEPILQGYALVSVPNNVRGAANAVRQRARQLSYVEDTVPVVSEFGSDQKILVPNELIVKVEGDLEQVDAALSRNGLERLRPVKFTRHRYVVRAKQSRGLDVFKQFNRLQKTPELKSVSINFVQNRLEPTPQDEADFTANQLLQSLDLQKKAKPRLFQWHFDSRPQLGDQAQRVDVLAPEALKSSKDGKGVVVAVLDSLIQWDHPDLKKNIYQVSDVADRQPGEQYGWDTVQDDADTRMSNSEKKWLTRRFRDSFTLSDGKLLRQYGNLGEFRGCQITFSKNKDQQASCVRNGIRDVAVHTFHGTHSAGVIAARSKKGIMGIAPKSKILPVRVLGLGGYGSHEDIIEGVSYAASRKADVINMSLGGRLSNAALADVIKDVLKDNPKLVIVASAGNNGGRRNYKGQLSYPAKYSGVMAVGATNIEGQSTFYTSWGSEVDVTAPGGETLDKLEHGILTTGGTFGADFWSGIETDQLEQWSSAFDPRGQYIFTQGTSFSAPVVSGVVALMKSADPKRKLSRQQLVDIVKRTASTDNLAPLTSSRQKLYYGSGLVNAQDAVKAVKEAL